MLISEIVKMFSRFQQPASMLARGLATSATSNAKVAVMGASGGMQGCVLYCSNEVSSKFSSILLSIFCNFVNQIFYDLSLGFYNLITKVLIVECQLFNLVSSKTFLNKL